MMLRNISAIPARTNVSSRFISTSTLRANIKPQIPQVPTQVSEVHAHVARPSRFKRYWRNTKMLFGISTGAAFGYVAWEIYKINFPSEQLKADHTKKKLVVLGSGWGSVSLLKTIDTTKYDVTVISPRNYFLFTPLLPSCTTGMIEHRSIMEPIRTIIRGKQTECCFVEGEVTSIDPYNRTLKVKTSSKEKAPGIPPANTEVSFDYLVIGVGSEVSTYGIPGVKEHGCFLKEIEHAQNIRNRIMDCIEAASFPGVDEATRKRLLKTVVVGGGPTGVEFAGELRDFYEEDLKKVAPELAKDLEVTLIEALPNVLPMFSKHLIDYTEETLRDENIQVMTKTAVKEVTETDIIAERTLPDGRKERVELPYGLFVWAGGNMVRGVVRELFQTIPEQNSARRGLLIDEKLAVKGVEGIWAVGDCTSSHYAPTAQVAAQQGSYLGGLMNRMARKDELEETIVSLESQIEKATPETVDQLTADLRQTERQRRRFSEQTPFQYSHQGSLAYIGSERAVADVTVWGNLLASGGQWTYLFWRSAYVSMCFGLRNKILVVLDWTKVKMFGRDVSRE